MTNNKTKRITFIGCLIIFAIQVVYAQQTDVRNVPAFNGIKVFGAIEVNLKKGNQQKIQIKAFGVDVNKVTTYVDDGLLKIKMQEGIYNNIDVKVDITYTNLIELNAGGSAKIRVNSAIQQRKLYVDANSGGSIELNVDLEAININLHSGGTLFIDGTVESQQIKVVSGAQLHALKLKSERINIKSNTGGVAEVYALDSINGSAATGGTIKYNGNPRIVNVKSSLGGNISRY